MLPVVPIIRAAILTEVNMAAVVLRHQSVERVSNYISPFLSFTLVITGTVVRGLVHSDPQPNVLAILPRVPQP